MSSLDYQQEDIDTIFDEGNSLLGEHSYEVNNLDDPLRIDYKKYLDLQGFGHIRVYTAREGTGELVGYAVWLLGSHPQHKDLFCAKQEAIYINPIYRGLNGEFIKYCDDRLMEEESVDLIFHHVKPKHDWSKLLIKNGYEHFENVYVRRV